MNSRPLSSRLPYQLVTTLKVRMRMMSGLLIPNRLYRRKRIATPPTRELRLRLKALQTKATPNICLADGRGWRI
ncbi:hypothetical protein D3C80_1720920 [compost metagenome]